MRVRRERFESVPLRPQESLTLVRSSMGRDLGSDVMFASLLSREPHVTASLSGNVISHVLGARQFCA
jgi:hypothetical protein